MMRSLFRILKSELPPPLSYHLRRMKSSLVDGEMQRLRLVARRVGGPGTVAIDVGANVGIYAGMLAKLFHHVYAIEPNPDCAGYMRAVLPSNCSVIECAASNQTGEVILKIPYLQGSVEATRGTIDPGNPVEGLTGSDIREVKVRRERLDALLSAVIDRNERITLLKVDVEGHEFAALRGARRILAEFRPALFLELEEKHGTRIGETEAYLQQFGYRRVPPPLGPRAGEDAVNVVMMTGTAPFLGSTLSTASE
jgi:FkbM family methyltransferase